MAVKVENSVENIKAVLDSSGKIIVGDENIFIRDLNFGIITQPEQRIKISKRMTNVKLTTGGNNVEIDGNPADAETKGVMDISAPDSDGCHYARAEVHDETLHGSTLEIKFKIEITNESDINYYGNQYYWFGNSEGQPEVTIKLESVRDELKNTLQLVSLSDGRKIKDDLHDGTYGEGKDKIEVQYFDIINWGDSIYTNKMPQTDKRPISTSTICTTKKVLDSTDSGDDLDFINVAEFEDYPLADEIEKTSACTASALHVLSCMKEV